MDEESIIPQRTLKRLPITSKVFLDAVYRFEIITTCTRPPALWSTQQKISFCHNATMLHFVVLVLKSITFIYNHRGNNSVQFAMIINTRPCAQTIWSRGQYYTFLGKLSPFQRDSLPNGSQVPHMSHVKLHGSNHSIPTNRCSVGNRQSTIKWWSSSTAMLTLLWYGKSMLKTSDTFGTSQKCNPEANQHRERIKLSCYFAPSTRTPI